MCTHRPLETFSATAIIKSKVSHLFVSLGKYEKRAEFERKPPLVGIFPSSKMLSRFFFLSWKNKYCRLKFGVICILCSICYRDTGFKDGVTSFLWLEPPYCAL